MFVELVYLLKGWQQAVLWRLQTIEHADQKGFIPDAFD
jgi:hypothetical protein